MRDTAYYIVPIFVLFNSGIKTTLHHWSRCDIPFSPSNGTDTILPDKCTPFLHAEEGADNVTVLAEALANVITDFKSNGYEAAFVYYTHVDTLGHQFGPDASETKEEIKMIDGIIKTFLDNLANEGLADTTNFIITADHGMSLNSDKVKYLHYNLFKNYSYIVNFSGI
ncbi:MAG TPA: hypothetical protein EYQ86_08165 [Bacteroidetes bacterium]|nr:hypothetical protein [Bacteroidota bacterium]